MKREAIMTSLKRGDDTDCLEDDMIFRVESNEANQNVKLGIKYWDTDVNARIDPRVYI
jgi:hypothetical protein